MYASAYMLSFHFSCCQLEREILFEEQQGGGRKKETGKVSVSQMILFDRARGSDKESVQFGRQFAGGA